MIKTSDGVQTKRSSGKPGDRVPATGIKRDRAVYVAAGGETTLSLNTLSPAIAYIPGNTQLQLTSSVKGSMISGLDYFETTATSLTFPEALLAGEWLEVVKSAEITGVMAATPRPDMYSSVGVLGQTLVTADFSWTYNLNSTKAVGAVEAYLHGVLQTRGVDYTEVSLGTANTNQILFVDALLGGENIVLKPTYMVIDQSAQASTFNSQQLAGIQSGMTAGFQGFVDQSALISVPSTTIVGRAKIPNLAADLRASMGIDRIMTQAIVELQNEFGPAGERVFSALNDDRGLIRFVGGWSSIANASGQRNAPSAATDYIEVTFYGTGLNVSILPIAGAVNMTCATDGGSAVSYFSASQSGVLQGRNYSPNVIISAVSGLALGVHTVKLVDTTGNSQYSGFEVINASASVSVNPGTAYNNGQKLTLATAASLAFNTGVTGTRGGRQLVYLTSAGVVANAFQAVNATQANLTAADHTNEELVRTYGFREFGAGRTDDFSTMTGSYSARAFVLDDGTTCLSSPAALAYNVYSGAAEMFTVNTANYFTFTFVGTGLDMLVAISNTATDNFVVVVDGVSLGNITGSGATPSVSSTFNQKIVSGLPYGTHTVKVTRTAAGGNSISFGQFKVYQPKKPILPAGAVELADYNVMADLVAATGDHSTFSTGTLIKSVNREFTYVGTNWTNGTGTNVPGGATTSTTTAGEYFEYTFFGTGIEIPITYSATPSPITVQFDGAAYIGTAVVTNTGTWTPGTSTITLASTGVLFRITGQTLGIHKIRLTKSVTADIMRICGVNIITPIHSAKSNLYGDLQNTLLVGSQGISDNRKTSAIKEILPATKAWAQAVGISSAPTTTSAALIPCPDMSLTVKTSGSPIEIRYSVLTYLNTANVSVSFAMFVDGIQVGKNRSYAPSTAANESVVSDSFIVPVSTGTHKVDLYWASNGSAIVTAHTDKRDLSVKEI